MRVIDELTKFIFIEDEPQKADIIFIPGGSYPEIAERAAELWRNGFAPYILPTGKYSIKLGYFPGPKSKNDIYSDKYITEWEFLKDILIKNGVDYKAIYCEDQSETTIDNAFRSKEVTDMKGLTVKKAIICCKAFHARRVLMSYSWAYPETEFCVCPSIINNISKDNWYSSQKGIDVVTGEVFRCGNQFNNAFEAWGSMLKDETII